MHIGVCDDNIDELSRIASLLEDFRRERKDFVTYEAFHSGIELMEAMNERQYDLLILDILMPGITGMEVAKELRNSSCDIPIIFLTSSREFAVESYRVHAEDYIMKPARKDELFPVLDRQLAKFSHSEAYLTIKTGSGITKLSLSQIVYVEVINRTVQFTLSNGETREAYGYLSEYESILLSDSSFYKPHRSYVVNLRHVTELIKDGFVTISENTVPIARDSLSKAKAAYMKYLLSPNERRA